MRLEGRQPACRCAPERSRRSTGSGLRSASPRRGHGRVSRRSAAAGWPRLRRPRPRVQDSHGRSQAGPARMPKVTMRSLAAASRRGGKGGVEGRHVAHDMIRGADKHGRLWIGRRDMEQRCQNGRSSVSGRRFQQDGAGVGPYLGHLLGDNEAEIRSGDNDRFGKARPRHAPDRSLEQAFVTNQRGKLLGIAPPGQRPEPCTGPAAQQDRGDLDLRRHLKKALRVNGMGQNRTAPQHRDSVPM